MQIIINEQETAVLPGETLLETARRIGYEIPSLCYSKADKHKSSCMVCAVKNKQNGQIIPSCTTLPTPGMEIETESEEIRLIRSLSLELLLSDHKADCEAPCSMVCPAGLDIEMMLRYYDNQRYPEAYHLIQLAFSLPEIACDTCKVPCEKACRRGAVDKAVSIRAIIKTVLEQKAIITDSESEKAELLPVQKIPFNSRLGRFTEKEKHYLKENIKSESRCLHCACAGESKCKLRRYAANAKIKRPRYEATSVFPAMHKEHITGNLWFEQAKCIRCGLCVYNTDNGFTFKDRGFGMQIIIPAENKKQINESIAGICPTGALYCVNH